MGRIVIASLLCAAFTHQTTVWGGNGIELQVGAKSATVEFDCARGTIDAPLKPDSNGHFAIKGTFTPEHPGPVREDSSQSRPATYAGTIKDDAMTLTVTFSGDDAPPPMTFELARGRDGNVRKCR